MSLLNHETGSWGTHFFLAKVHYLDESRLWRAASDAESSPTKAYTIHHSSFIIHHSSFIILHVSCLMSHFIIQRL